MSKSKHKSISKSNDTPSQGQDSLLGLFARLFWSLIGNIVLLSVSAKIYQTHILLSMYDLVFWGIVFLVITVRYCDIKYLKGITADGQPATMDHWRKYAKYYLLISAALWILSHILSFLNR
ncbi:MAG: hypothetical protein ABFD91_16475 [Anaerohalosphaeraceae bacterium]